MRKWSPTFDIKTVPDNILASEMGRRNAAKRKNPSGGRNGGRPKSEDRCPCGASTLTRARARSFDCCRKAGKMEGV